MAKFKNSNLLISEGKRIYMGSTAMTEENLIGSLQVAINNRLVTSDSAADPGETLLVDASLGNVMIDVTPENDVRVTIKKIDSSSFLVKIRSVTGLIEGLETVTLENQYEYISITCDGTNWWVTSGISPEPPGPSMQFQIENASPFTIPIFDGGAGFTHDFVVNWGDGTPNSTITSFDDPAATHNYAAPGTYDITMTGLCEYFAFNYGGDSGQVTKLLEFVGDNGLKELNFAGCSNLNTIVPLGIKASLTTLGGVFAYAAITSIPDNMFSGLEAVTTFQSAFEGCNNIETIGNNTFAGCTGATNFNNAFAGCETSLTTIGDNTFAGCTSVTAFGEYLYLFEAHYNLITIGENTFAGCTAATNFNLVFAQCTSLQAIPASTFTGCTAARDFWLAFGQCTSLTSIPDSLFEGMTSIVNVAGNPSDSMFSACTGITTIGNNIFAGCTGIENFNGIFAALYNLTTVGNNLFAGCSNATHFASIFADCFKLETIGTGMFTGCTSADYFFFGYAPAFQNCYALQAIPAGLFDDCKNASDMFGMFAGCRSLTTVPDELFKDCQAAEMGGIFYGCTSLLYTGKSTFEGCNNLSSNGVQFMFQGCTALTTIGERLFYGCSSGPEWEQDMFDGCTSLTTIEDSAFEGCAGMIVGSGFFADCPITTVGNNVFKDWAAGGESYQIFYNKTTLRTVGHGTFLNGAGWTDGMFYGCTSLVSIGDDTFNGTQKAANWGEAFSGCTSLESIGDRTFYGCSGVRSMEGCFYNCSSLTTIGSDTFTGCDSVENASRIFYGCSSLVSLPADLMAGFNRSNQIFFGEAFKNCTSLESITDNLFAGFTERCEFTGLFAGCSSLTTIGNGTFEGCIGQQGSYSDLIDVFLGCTSITTIGNNTFKDCVGLQSLSRTFFSLPLLSTIGDSTFEGCGSLYELFETFKNCTNLTSIGSNTFNGINTGGGILLERTFENTGLVEIPDYFFTGMTVPGVWGYETFKDCTSLETIGQFAFSGFFPGPASMDGMFSGCTALTSIPGGLFDTFTDCRVFSYMFEGCTSLTTIGDGIFSKCSDLMNADRMFKDCSSLEAIPVDLFLTDPFVPTAPEPGEFSGTNRVATSQAEFDTALSDSLDGDSIEVTALIVMTSTKTINKRVRIHGSGSIESAGAAGDPVALVSVSAAGVFLDDIFIKHKKTSNTSVEAAVSVNALDFVSTAKIEFMEFGYTLKGSFNIKGTTTYTGALGNNHRHIIIYKIDAVSAVNDVSFDFPQEATPRSRFILVSGSVPGDKFNAPLVVRNNRQADLNKIMSQFFMQDTFQSDGGAALIFMENAFNDLNGGIGMVPSATTPLNFYDNIMLIDNFQGQAGIASYKGLFYIDGSGSGKDIGSTTLYVARNIAPNALRVDYTWGYDEAIAYNNTVYGIPATPLVNKTSNIENISSMFENCTSIYSALDSTMFVGCALASNFQNTFKRCTSLTGEGLPVIASIGINCMPQVYGGCFSGCTSLTDYNLIPGAWGGPSFMFTIQSASPFTLPIAGGGAGYTHDFVVTWDMLDPGEGSDYITSYDSSAATHMYATSGPKIISIVGKCEWFAFNNSGDKDMVISMDALTGDTRAKVLNFYGCSNLPEIKYMGVMDSLETTENMFRDCTSLTQAADLSSPFRDIYFGEIGNNMFAGCSGITNFNDAFRGCHFTSTGVGVFEGCTSAISFENTFMGSSLTSIPAGLFDTCTLIESVKGVFQESNITSVPDNLFNGMQSLYVIDNVFNSCTHLVSIGSGTFEGCPSIYFATGVFEGCSSLEEIGDRTFKSCSGLAGINQEPGKFLFKNLRSLVTIGDDTFKDCEVLSADNNQTVENLFEGCTNLTTIGTGTFSGCDYIMILKTIFKDCTSLEAVPVGFFTDVSNLYQLTQVFYGCTSLVNVQDSLFEGMANLVVVEELFKGCTSLATVGNNLFKDCVNLYQVYSNNTFIKLFANLPSLRTIGNNTFSGCEYLQIDFRNVFTNPNIVSIGSGTFEGCKADIIESPFLGCSSLETIGDNTFKDCSAIVVNHIFKNCTSLTSIPDGMFKDMPRLEYAHEPFSGCTSLTTIGDDTFSGCSSLATFLDPMSGGPHSESIGVFKDLTSLVTIGNNTFNGCANLREMEESFRGCSSLTTIGTGTFLGCGPFWTFNQTFYGCSSLEAIPPNLFNEMGNKQIDEMRQPFMGCSSITEIPVNVPGPSVFFPQFSVLVEAFRGCTSLASLPDELFSNHGDYIYRPFYGCTALTTVGNKTFYSLGSYTEFCDPNNMIRESPFYGMSSIETIGDDTFAHNALVRITDIFKGCSSLTTIGARTFENSGILSLYGAFEGCVSLGGVPSDTFYRSITDNLSSLFKDCTSLGGDIADIFGPGDNNDGVYEMFQITSDYYSMFKNCSHLSGLGQDIIDMIAASGGNPMSTSYCFTGCTGLTDYATIPAAWGGGGA